MDTHSAPAGREAPEELQRQIALVQQSPLLVAVLDAFPLPTMILNDRRQVVAANRRLLRLLGATPEQVLGKRTGEIVGCAFWREGPDGCGTSRHCLTCGAVDAMLQSQATQRQVTRECRLTLDTAIDGGARDLRVTAAPVVVDSQHFSACTIEDISQQKRLAVLTRAFFHDVLNTAGGIRGFTEMLLVELPEDWRGREDVKTLERLSGQLIEEIESQRDLTRAESGDLQVTPGPVRVAALLEELRALYSSHPVARDRRIEMKEVWEGRIMSDARLLARVLGNMLKNALEATERGGAVWVECLNRGSSVEFRVHNRSVMPEEVQLQVFRRSFSTKGETGRGIGTYSMKLLGETYLGGRIGFTSQAPEGTTFFFLLPKVFFGTASTAGADR